jgi:hypothetical protein
MTAAHLLSGPDSYVWKGDNVGYLAAHYRVYSEFGKASTYQCAEGFDHQAHEWAYQGGDANEKTDPRGRVYSPNPHFYIPLCRSHHRRLDFAKRRAVTA